MRRERVFAMPPPSVTEASVEGARRYDRRMSDPDRKGAERRGPAQRAGPLPLDQALTSMLRRCARCAFGTRTVKTPSFNFASIFSASICSGSATR